MYRKRMTTYKKNGFRLISQLFTPTQDVQSFYDQDNYVITYDDDLLKANKSSIISCDTLAKKVVLQYIQLLKTVHERGVLITVVCLDPHSCHDHQQLRGTITLLYFDKLAFSPPRSSSFPQDIVSLIMNSYGMGMWICLLSKGRDNQVMLRY